MEYPYSLITIGASAGGLRPVIEIISKLPSHKHAFIVFVPHLFASHKSNLNTILAKFTSMCVKKAEQGEHLKPDRIYLLPENKIMTVKDGCLLLRERKPNEIINKAIDIFLSSAALDAKNKAICIILSGAGNDGLLGAQEIHKHHGLVIVQDPKTAEFPYMPEAIISGDSPDAILTPEEIAKLIVNY
ncbi:chemotaxis protein CheB [Pedobacter polysacchareus]|uniref:chemotaxis protein CheB n=1 Tax=Pedobacter polysacchareus TaxID=2861973 RepID=UPI001C98EA81|nr:chemotaxis protein CheB [Pedobacter polysacchareus]